MNLQYKLLEHPFYKDWECGKITTEQLSAYSKSYREFIELMPVFWQKISDALPMDNDIASTIISEENQHIAFWDLWTTKFQEVTNFPHLNELIGYYNDLSPQALLGAVLAFEVQQPEVAKTKKAGLLNHYNFKIEDLIYFDEHELEDKHVNYGLSLFENLSDKSEFENGFNRASELLYHGLDKFMISN